MIWKFFLIAIIAFVLESILEKYIICRNIKKHYKEKHYCNNCECGFLANNYVLGFTHCPYCGQPLDYHEKDERSRDYKEDDRNE